MILRNWADSDLCWGAHVAKRLGTILYFLLEFKQVVEILIDSSSMCTVYCIFSSDIALFEFEMQRVLFCSNSGQ